jgi:hypothetical protein
MRTFTVTKYQDERIAALTLYLPGGHSIYEHVGGDRC